MTNLKNSYFRTGLTCLVWNMIQHLSCFPSTPIHRNQCLDRKQDTLKLICLKYACECPEWADYKKYFAEKKDSLMPNLDWKNLYYIENCDKTIPDSIMKAGIVVDFIGKTDSVQRLVKNYPYMSPDPLQGNVFVYSNFKVIEYAISW